MQALRYAGLLGRLRSASRPTAPQVCGLADLIPYRDLEQSVDSAPGSWQALSAHPRFLIRHHFPAGWVRLRLKMTAAVPGRFRLFAELGDDFDAAMCLQSIEVGGEVNFDGFVAISAPVNGLRLDPLGKPGGFRLEILQIEPLTRFQAWRPRAHF